MTELQIAEPAKGRELEQASEPGADTDDDRQNEKDEY
jgi:hypothetical protein